MDTGNRLLLNVLKLANELYNHDRSDTHPSQPGHPKAYSDFKMFKVATLATLKKKRKPCEMHWFLKAHADLCHACGFDVRTRRELEQQGLNPDVDLPGKRQPLPCERTFRRRLPKLDTTTRRQIHRLGNHLIEEEKVTDAEIVSVDKKMIEAQGPLWHKKDRDKGRIPEG